jgi:hypothetical protein
MRGGFNMSRQGYWSLHEYHRLSVSSFVEEFCGWQPLIELVELAGSPREQAFISALFLTGSRVSECLLLRKNMFEVRRRERVIVCRGVPLFKRYRKIEETRDEEGRRRWITERVEAKRKPFPISLREPLVPYLLSWLERLPAEDSLLFESPYKPGSALTRFWAYHVIRDLDSRLNPELRQRLGLDKPFVADGRLISDRLHLWLHWFRSQRASQLVAEYGFEVIDLVDFFSWESYDTALTYSRRGWKGLASKMRRK